jgi:5-formyltetrahydrofolate cyclo-ligase
MTTDPDDTRCFASPPCMAAEFEGGPSDPQQTLDVARWRKAERTRLRAERMAMSVEARLAAGTGLAMHLADFVCSRFGGTKAQVFSFYWPIKGEPDLRPLMTRFHNEGFLIALPIVEVKAAPLVFRRWTPDTRMQRGDWNIPVPPPEAEEIVPDLSLAPLVGWTADGYRLGYGGGYFDRTLAALSPRPFTIGIGFQSAQLKTIFPQSHDIPLNAIVTEEGLQYTDA